MDQFRVDKHIVKSKSRGYTTDGVVTMETKLRKHDENEHSEIFGEPFSTKKVSCLFKI